MAASILTLRAQNFSVLDVLGSGQGSQPFAGLAAEGSVLFGVTAAGGSHGNGNVFVLNGDGSGLRDLYDFGSLTNAAGVKAGLVVSGSTLYGVGYQGGSANGYGVVYAIGTDGTGYTNLHVFAGGADGANPRGTLVLAGNTLFGTTQFGAGGSGNGTVYSLNSDGTGFNTLFTFAGTNGSQPYGGLVLAGNLLYGTTYRGGAANLGTVFSLTTNGGTFSLLHNFSNNDGTLPAAGLALSSGTLYGTASAGGASGNNYGTIFSLATNGSNFTVLHNFTGATSDGDTPRASLLVSSNVLYGTASGATSGHGGTVFSLGTNGGNFSVFNGFSGGSGGGDPESTLVLADTSLYGTTVGGGDANNDGTVFGVQLSGVVFAQQPAPVTGLSAGAAADFYYAGFSLTSSQPLQYQWRLNGVNIPGQTDYDLEFANAQPTNGGIVSIAVSDGVDAPNSFAAAFSVSTAISAAGNDNFANRFQLAQAGSGILSSDNTLATRENGEPVILPGNPGGKSIWFRWNPTTTGVVTFTTAGSTFDTMMGVYTGTSVSGLTREPSAVSDDDSGGFLTSKVSFNAAVGQEYEIVVDGNHGASGHVILSWQTAGASSVLPVILTEPTPLTVTSNGATVTLVCQANTGTITWFYNGQPTSVTGPINVIGPVTDASIGTWVAQVASQNGVALSQPSRIEISTLEDGSTDTNSAAMPKFLDSVGASYVQPALVHSIQPHVGDSRGYSVSQVFSTVGATGEPGEPNIAGQIGGSPAWYVYVTPAGGTLKVNTEGSSFNTLLGVFTGPGNSFATLMSQGEGYTTNRTLNGQPHILLTNVPAQQTNYIVVDGYQGASGTVHLNIAVGDPVAISVPPQNQFAVAGSNATFAPVATGSTPLSYTWFHAGTNLPGQTNSSLTITNVQTSKAGTYTVLVSNLISAASNSATLAIGTLPGITTQPVSHTVHSNSTGALSVTASGTPAPSYQWFFNASNTGVTASALSIPNFSTSNQGSYAVLVSNALGTITSSNAILLFDTPFRLGASSLSGTTFQLQLIGIASSNYVIEGSTNLVNWVRLATNNSATGFIDYSDTNAAAFGRRFYRTTTN